MLLPVARAEIRLAPMRDHPTVSKLCQSRIVDGRAFETSWSDLLLKTPSWSRLFPVQDFAMFVPQSRAKRSCWGVQWTFCPSGNVAEARSDVRETILGQHVLIVPLSCGPIDQSTEHKAERPRKQCDGYQTDLVDIPLRSFQPRTNTLQPIHRLVNLMLHSLERSTHSIQN